MVVMREGSGEDNGIVIFVKNPAIMQEFMKRVKKKVIYWSEKIEYSFFY